MSERIDGLTLAIIQARMASTRLPGKVMMEIIEKPILYWVFERVRRAELVDRVVVGTSVNELDDEIEEFCLANDIEVRRGDEDDVLNRFYEIVKELQPSLIVRITADCPLVDPEVIDGVIDGMGIEGMEYCSNVIRRTYPRGLDTEVFTYEVLERVWKSAKLPYEREHVTPYIYNNPDNFMLFNFNYDHNFTQIRLTVDEEKDLELVRCIYEELYKEGEIFTYEDVLNLLKEKPHLIEMNTDVDWDVLNKSFLERDEMV
jgi:spore coat polysaccharide biosynthesis protein SpsF